MPNLKPKSLLKLLGGLSKANPSTGMQDSVPAMIDGQQPAALSEGEFVVPADVVSMIGDGNSEAGSQILSKMVEEVRVKKMGKKSQPEEMAKLFLGGKVRMPKESK